MKPVVYLIQIILGLLIIFIIVIQQKGSGLGAAFGSNFSFYRSKRGAEKILFLSTIILSVAFIISSVIGLML